MLTRRTLLAAPAVLLLRPAALTQMAAGLELRLGS